MKASVTMDHHRLLTSHTSGGGETPDLEIWQTRGCLKVHFSVHRRLLVTVWPSIVGGAKDLSPASLCILYVFCVCVLRKSC